MNMRTWALMKSSTPTTSPQLAAWSWAPPIAPRTSPWRCSPAPHTAWCPQSLPPSCSPNLLRTMSHLRKKTGQVNWDFVFFSPFSWDWGRHRSWGRWALCIVPRPFFLFRKQSSQPASTSVTEAGARNVPIPAFFMAPGNGMGRRSGGGRGRAPPNLDCLSHAKFSFPESRKGRQAGRHHQCTTHKQRSRTYTCAQCKHVPGPGAPCLPSAQAQPIRHDANSRAMGDHWSCRPWSLVQ